MSPERFQNERRTSLESALEISRSTLKGRLQAGGWRLVAASWRLAVAEAQANRKESFPLDGRVLDASGLYQFFALNLMESILKEDSGARNPKNRLFIKQ